MAESFPNEGLDLLLGIVPKGGATLATMYMGLWTTGGTNIATPAATAVLATQTGVGEAAFPGYARQSIAAGTWGAISTQTIWGQAGARACSAPQEVFPGATGSYATAINGFFLSNALTGGVAIFYSNFDDTTAIATMALGDIIKVTPTFGLLG